MVLTSPAGIYLLKVNNRNTKTYFTSCSSDSIANFEYVNAGWVLNDLLHNIN